MRVARRLEAAVEATGLDADSAVLASAKVESLEALKPRLLSGTRPVLANLVTDSGQRHPVIMKWASATSRAGAWSKGHSRPSTLINEVATRRVAVLMGSPYDKLVPPVALRPDSPATAIGPHTAMSWRPGKDLKPITWLMLSVPAMWRAAALFDFISGQQDRHPGNFLWDADNGGQLTLIDHGLAFAARRPPTQSMLYRSRLRERRARALANEERLALQTLTSTIRNGDVLGRMLTASALAGLLRRSERADRQQELLPWVQTL